MKNYKIGKTLLTNRSNAPQKIKPNKSSLKSIVEYDNIGEFIDSAFIPEFTPETPEIYKYSFPPRCKYQENQTKNEYKQAETDSFAYWKQQQPKIPFEKNIEIWRQFWITCERSDLILQIVDARSPLFYFNSDILKVYPNKKHVILINKCDLINNFSVWEEYFKNIDVDVIFHSCITGQAFVNGNQISLCEYLIKYNMNIGLVGYPNVGKSSTINSIFKQKKVQVSKTPGKTKHIQTLVFNETGILISDCPGLIFSKHTKSQLLLNGALNADQIMDIRGSLVDVVEYIGVSSILKYYKITGFINDSRNTPAWNLVYAMAKNENFDCGKYIKQIVKDYMEGKLTRSENNDLEVTHEWFYEKKEISDRTTRRITKRAARKLLKVSRVNEVK
ncbi:Large subunit GTPase 1 [Astathelohania contejeani]|uniref:Large subunit GTPase 1 n=1 Tax=Astathelohania contejeani TaxID=164912 RepID=A0ABQ7I268_9MICR|nr:Large subunit GTPase 1 [Thelohania contejeani]